MTSCIDYEPAPSIIATSRASALVWNFRLAACKALGNPQHAAAIFAALISTQACLTLDTARIHPC